MRDRLKILKWLGCLFLLCILSSTMAFSEGTSKYMENRATIAKMTHANAIEHQNQMGILTHLRQIQTENASYKTYAFLRSVLHPLRAD